LLLQAAVAAVKVVMAGARQPVVALAGIKQAICQYLLALLIPLQSVAVAVVVDLDHVVEQVATQYAGPSLLQVVAVAEREMVQSKLVVTAVRVVAVL
jgi:hypothetical protein